jgi:hypothetical protein
MLAYQVFGFLVIGQQAVDQFVAYGHFCSLQSYGSFPPNDRLHKISYTLDAGLSVIQQTQANGHTLFFGATWLAENFSNYNSGTHRPRVVTRALL